MRALLRSRKVGAAVLAAVVLLATPFGMKSSLQRACDKISDGFTSGVYLEDEDYTATGAATYVEEVAKSALGLISVGAGYDSVKGATDNLRAAREELIAATGAGDAGDANAKLLSASRELISALENVELSDKDAENLAAYSDDLSDWEGALTAAARYYDQSVETFRGDVAGRFPAKLIAALLNVEMPEYFGG